MDPDNNKPRPTGLAGSRWAPKQSDDAEGPGAGGQDGSGTIKAKNTTRPRLDQPVRLVDDDDGQEGRVVGSDPPTLPAAGRQNEVVEAELWRQLDEARGGGTGKGGRDGRPRAGVGSDDDDHDYAFVDVEQGDEAGGEGNTTLDMEDQLEKEIKAEKEGMAATSGGQARLAASSESARTKDGEETEAGGGEGTDSGSGADHRERHRKSNSRILSSRLSALGRDGVNAGPGPIVDLRIHLMGISDFRPEDISRIVRYADFVLADGSAAVEDEAAATQGTVLKLLSENHRIRQQSDERCRQDRETIFRLRQGQNSASREIETLRVQLTAVDSGERVERKNGAMKERYDAKLAELAEQGQELAETKEHSDELARAIQTILSNIGAVHQTSDDLQASFGLILNQHADGQADELVGQVAELKAKFEDLDDALSALRVAGELAADGGMATTSAPIFRRIGDLEHQLRQKTRDLESAVDELESLMGRYQSQQGLLQDLTSAAAENSRALAEKSQEADTATDRLGSVEAELECGRINLEFANQLLYFERMARDGMQKKYQELAAATGGPLGARIEAITKSLMDQAEFQGEINKMKTFVKTTTGKIGSLEAGNSRLSKEVASLKDERAGLQADLDGLAAKVRDQEEEMSKKDMVKRDQAEEGLQKYRAEREELQARLAQAEERRACSERELMTMQGTCEHTRRMRLVKDEDKPATLQTVDELRCLGKYYSEEAFDGDMDKAWEAEREQARSRGSYEKLFDRHDRPKELGNIVDWGNYWNLCEFLQLRWRVVNALRHQDGEAGWDWADAMTRAVNLRRWLGVTLPQRQDGARMPGRAMQQMRFSADVLWSVAQFRRAAAHGGDVHGPRRARAMLGDMEMYYGQDVETAGMEGQYVKVWQELRELVHERLRAVADRLQELRHEPGVRCSCETGPGDNDDNDDDNEGGGGGCKLHPLPRLDSEVGSRVEPTWAEFAEGAFVGDTVHTSMELGAEVWRDSDSGGSSSPVSDVA